MIINTPSYSNFTWALKMLDTSDMHDCVLTLKDPNYDVEVI